MQAYRASNRVPFGGFLLLLLVGAVVAIGVGLLMWAVETYIHLYLILVFPIFAGAIVGGVLAWAVRAGKARSPLIVGLIGLAAGVLAYGTYHFAGYYITFRDSMREAYIENTGRTPTEEQFNRELDELLDDEYGATGFIGYLTIIADEGFSISRTGSSSSSSGLELQGNIVWGYFAVELLIIIGFAVFLPARAAGEPFDEDDNTWYGAPVLIGMADNKTRKDLIRALEAGDFQGAGRMLTTDGVRFPRTDVMIRRSPVQNAMPQDVFISVNQTQRQGRTNVTKTGVISPTELNWLMDAMHGGSRASATVSRGGEVSAPDDIFDL